MVINRTNNTILGHNARCSEYFQMERMFGEDLSSIVTLCEDPEAGAIIECVLLSSKGQFMKYSITCSSIYGSSELLLLELEPELKYRRSRTFSFDFGSAVQVEERQNVFVDDETGKPCKVFFDDCLGVGGAGDVYAGEFGEEPLEVAIKIMQCRNEVQASLPVRCASPTLWSKTTSTCLTYPLPLLSHLPSHH